MARVMTTAKMSVDSLRMLRLAAALTGEKQYEVLERALKAELSKIESRSKSKKGRKTDE